MVQKMERTPELGLKILGYIDAENPNSCNIYDKTKRLGYLEDLEMLLKEEVVDEVFVFLPIKSFYFEIQLILKVCETAGIEVKIPADLFSLKLAKATISRYDGIPVIDLYTSPKMNWQLFVKRLMDMMTSGLLLSLLSPLFLLVAVLIKTTSRGPIFFVQRRVGYNGRQFSCLKFRTMVQDAEERREELLHLNELTGPVFKIRNDPRVTPLGRWLRKMSIDEFPQLINVFWGDMSLVGPRPPIPNEVDQYPLNDRRRLSVKPGITCLWQVNGRNRIPFEEWMELDRQYIDDWSLRLDLKILAKTIPAVLRGSGAS
jgi:exopolysaccharide biosynthesis polyprenyl glycosylphosphotransferase